MKLAVLFLFIDAATAQMECSSRCSGMNNDNDKYSYDQLVVYDPSCARGGVGCNAQGNDQLCRFCTWQGSHSTPGCPQCACAENGLNGCYGSSTSPTNQSKDIAATVSEDKHEQMQEVTKATQEVQHEKPQNVTISSGEMQCSSWCRSMNNDNDKYSYDQLVVYDPSCARGGVGCNAQGNDQLCRFCTWRGSHSTPGCPQCACTENGLSGCYGSDEPSDSSTIVV